MQTGGTLSHSEQNDIQANAIVNPGNAHNSYLHIFAENGMVGLFLLLFLWWNLYQHLESGRLPYGALSRFEQGALFAFQALLISALVGALFGHALASPALGVVVMAACGTGLGAIRQASNRVRTAEWVTMNE
jgi:O-antigen ligase